MQQRLKPRVRDARIPKPMQTHWRTIGAIFLMTLSTISQAADVPSIVPRPQEIATGSPSNLAVAGPWTLLANTRIYIADDKVRPIAESLKAHVQPATGFDIEIITKDPKPGDITLTTQTVDAT